MAAKRALLTNILIAGTSELAGKIPGGSTCLTVVQKVFAMRAEERARELFTAIGVATGSADPEDAAAQLAQNANQPWFQEAIEAGFRELMNCTDPAVRACIAVLVAEYVVVQKSPDLKFRRAGAVLQNSDGANIKTLLQITDAYVQALAQAKPGLRVLIRSSPTAATGETFWVAASRAAGPGMDFSTVAQLPTDFDDCTRALVNAGIGQLWTGLSDSNFKGEPVLAFQTADDDVVRLLDTCIRTGCLQSVQPEPDSDASDPSSRRS